LDIQGEFQFLVPVSNIPLALENDNDANIDSISNDIKNLTTTDSNGADKSSHDQYIPTATEQEYFQNSSFQNSTSLLALIRNGKLARNQSPLLDIEVAILLPLFMSIFFESLWQLISRSSIMRRRH